MLAILACLPLCGCFHLGAERLDQDEIGYSQALDDADKRLTLLNIVRVRYADMPDFLETTQVISGYQLQQSVTGGFELFPAAHGNTYLSGGGTAQFQESPTFTFQPVDGEQFAESFIRPLAPAELLPLILSGMPIDVLFRLGVQSANGLQNTLALAQSGSAGSPDFFLLLHDLRVLQIAGLLDIRLENREDQPEQKGKEQGAVYLAFAPTTDPALSATAAEAERLLGMRPGEGEVQVIYGGGVGAPGQITILTRSMLGVLEQLAVQIDVPAADVASGETIASVGDVGIERRPIVIVHSSDKEPRDAFVMVQYGKTWFWIDDRDFDSKVAFTIVQTLLDLAKTTSAPGAVITIPAG